jgi:phage terminase small subunit
MSSKKAAKKGAKKSVKAPSTRRKKLEDAVLDGKIPATAARDAGYSESYARVDVYRTLANPSFQERLAARRMELARRAQIHTDMIIGSLAEIATASMADVVPDDELLQRAQELGTDHLIKKLKVKTRYISNGPGRDPDKEVTHEFEMYSRLDALGQLRDTFGMKQEPRPNTQAEIGAAIADFIRAARDSGLGEVGYEEARQFIEPRMASQAVQ